MIRTRTGLAAAVTAAALALGAAAASAQVVAIGSTQRGGTSQIGRAIAAAVSEGSPLSARPQELANTADYIPLVNAGELDFGVANMVQLDFAVAGEGMSAGRPHQNLRMVEPSAKLFHMRGKFGTGTPVTSSLVMPALAR